MACRCTQNTHFNRYYYYYYYYYLLIIAFYLVMECKYGIKLIISYVVGINASDYILLLFMIKGGNEMIHFQMMSSSSSSRKSRKLLRMGAMQDYDDTGANSKHDPRKKPGKPWSIINFTSKLLLITFKLLISISISIFSEVLMIISYSIRKKKA